MSRIFSGLQTFMERTFNKDNYNVSEYFKLFPEHRGILLIYDIDIENSIEKIVQVVDLPVINVNINTKKELLKEKHILIIRDVQYFVNEITKGKGVELYEAIMKLKNIKLIMTSSNPILEFPFELSPLFNMLYGEEVFPRKASKFSELYIDETLLHVHHNKKFRRIVNGYVSYNRTKDIRYGIDTKKVVLPMTDIQKRYHYIASDYKFNEANISYLSCIEHKNTEKNIEKYSPKIKKFGEDIEKLDKDTKIAVFSRFDYTKKIIKSYIKRSITIVDKIIPENIEYLYIMEPFYTISPLENLLLPLSAEHLKKIKIIMYVIDYNNDKVSTDMDYLENCITIMTYNDAFVSILAETAIDRKIFNIIYTRNVIAELLYTINTI